MADMNTDITPAENDHPAIPATPITPLEIAQRVRRKCTSHFQRDATVVMRHTSTTPDGE